MSEIDVKDKAKKDKADADKKRRRDDDNDTGAGDGTSLMSWDADVEEFMELLERKLGGLRTAMTSIEFKSVVSSYRELSALEKRAVANRLQKKGLANLLRAIHGGDFRLYLDHWQAEAEAVQEATNQPANPGDPV
jgi:hypothetical protein